MKRFIELTDGCRNIETKKWSLSIDDLANAEYIDIKPVNETHYTAWVDIATCLFPESLLKMILFSEEVSSEFEKRLDKQLSSFMNMKVLW